MRLSRLTHSLVEGWLVLHGMDTEMITHNAAFDWINLNPSVGATETLLRTEYHEFWHQEYHVSAIRAPKWSLPEYLHDHIEANQPTSSFLGL